MIFSLICVYFVFAGLQVESIDYDKKIEEFESKIKSEQKNLQKIENEINEKEKNIQTLKKEEKKVADEINKTGTDLIKVRRDINKIDKNISKSKENISRANEELDTAQEASLKARKQLQTVIETIYQQNKIALSYSDFFVSRENYASLIRKDRALQVVSDKIDVLYKQRMESEDKALQSVEVFEKKKNKLATLKTSAIKKQQLYSSKKKKTEEQLQIVKSKQTLEEKKVNGLKKSVADMYGLIDNLRKELSVLHENQLRMLDKLSIVEKKGKLAWPVTGMVVSNFGKRIDPALKTNKFNNGIEIKAQKGSKVAAIEKGIVLFADTFMNYGNTVIIEHGNDVCTVYGHLDRLTVKVGEPVNISDVIAVLGPSNLYFEVRLHNKPENPLLWLK